MTAAGDASTPVPLRRDGPGQMPAVKAARGGVLA
jgi:hypothetical protein